MPLVQVVEETETLFAHGPPPFPSHHSQLASSPFGPQLPLSQYATVTPNTKIRAISLINKIKSVYMVNRITGRKLKLRF